jgi:hypothetical protein
MDNTAKTLKVNVIDKKTERSGALDNNLQCCTQWTATLYKIQKLFIYKFNAHSLHIMLPLALTTGSRNGY